LLSMQLTPSTHSLQRRWLYLAELASSNYSTRRQALTVAPRVSVDPLGLGLGSDDTLYLGNYQDLTSRIAPGAHPFGEQNPRSQFAQIVTCIRGTSSEISRLCSPASSSGLRMTATTPTVASMGLTSRPSRRRPLPDFSDHHAASCGSFTGSITFTQLRNNSKSQPSLPSLLCHGSTSRLTDPVRVRQP